MAGSYIVAGARTPIGKMSGALASFTAADLGAFAIKAALERSGVAATEVEHVIMGQVLMAGQGQVPSRQAAVKAGIPMSVPAVNINKVCLSGLNAIYLADQMIQAGDADIVIAGGMESMTQAPYIAAGARGGFRYGNTELRDAIIADGLWCAFDACLMGLGTERYTAKNISREEQDDLAMKSNQRAAAAIAAGRLADEIVPVSIPQRKGDPLVVANDEGVRADTTMDSLGGLKPAFDKEGTITAANASQISDGGSAMVIMSERAVKARGVKPLGQIVSYGMVAGPDSASLLTQPSRAILKALDKKGMKVSDLDLFELNEAFAAVGIASMRDLGISDDVVNVNGGAIALGHPVGSTGSRLITTALHELERSDKEFALVTMCCGGAVSTGTIIQRIS